MIYSLWVVVFGVWEQILIFSLSVGLIRLFIYILASSYNCLRSERDKYKIASLPRVAYVIDVNKIQERSEDGTLWNPTLDRWFRGFCIFNFDQLGSIGQITSEPVINNSTYTIFIKFFQK